MFIERKKRPQRVVALEKQHSAKCAIRETATTRNFALWKLQ